MAIESADVSAALPFSVHLLFRGWNGVFRGVGAVHRRMRVLGYTAVLAIALDTATKVITGHFGLAAGAKSVDRRAPLWSLMLATVWLDLVFIPLLLLNVETIDTPPGGGYGTSVIHADYTHSLLGALVLSAAFGGVVWWRWDRRLGLLLAGVAFSHWVLDLIVHRGDMPILPGNAGDLPLLGFGLWKVPVATIVVEAALLLAGVFLYWRAARSAGSRRGGTVSPSIVVGALLASGVIVLIIDALGI
jgi:LexA-binding, inner membrane-associated putative hydrolase